MPLFTKPESRIKYQSNAPAKPSPLNIPELLVVIFSFLSQIILQNRVLFVCRQWNTIAKPLLLNRAITWTSNGGQDERDLKRMLCDLQQVYILNIRSHGSSMYRGFPSQLLNSICLSLSGLATDGRIKLRELNIFLPIHYEAQLFPLLDITGQFLTELQLTNLVHINIPLQGILVRCSQLQVLKMQSSHYTSSDNQFSNWQDTPLPDQLPLQSLSLRSIFIDSTVLVRVLRSCSNLVELQLIEHRQPNHASGLPGIADAGNRPWTVFEDSFLREVAILCPRLEMVHFSNRSDRSFYRSFPRFADNVANRLFSLFPNVLRWGLLSNDLNPGIFSTLKNQTNTITLLEIVNAANFGNDDTNCLHAFLCDSPQLQHLKAPYVTFPALLFDLEGTVDWTIWNHSQHRSYYAKYDKRLAKSFDRLIKPCHRKIWACRNLKTLHLNFHGPDGAYSTMDSRARLLFGYISKVCPRLQDLAIKGYCLGWSLEGGLCLLTRLHELRNLKIPTTALDGWHKRNGGWIPREMSQSFKIKMKIWFKKYNMLEQKRFYATSAFRTSANAYDPFTMEKFVHISGDTGTDDHMIDGVDMRYLGRLEDIAVYFQGRVSNSMPCWPYLEMIELDGMSPKFDKRGLRKMQNVQKVIKAYRPDIVVKLVR